MSECQRDIDVVGWCCSWTCGWGPTAALHASITQNLKNFARGQYCSLLIETCHILVSRATRLENQGELRMWAKVFIFQCVTLVPYSSGDVKKILFWGCFAIVEFLASGAHEGLFATLAYSGGTNGVTPAWHRKLQVALENRDENV